MPVLEKKNLANLNQQKFVFFGKHRIKRESWEEGTENPGKKLV